MNIFFDTLLKIGSLAGLASIVYQIHNNRKFRPSFRFTFEASGAEFFERDGTKFCKYHFPGIFRNASLAPNSIVRLYLTVWGSKKRGSALRYGHSVQEIKEIRTGEKKYLPLKFEPKQAFNLLVFFEFPIQGTADERLLSEFEEVRLPNATLRVPKHRYEFFIEDVNGNRFDYRGSSVSGELIDLWWTLPNYSNKPPRYGLQVLKIGWVFCKNYTNRFLEMIGLYK
jgi:hypothetical protein